MENACCSRADDGQVRRFNSETDRTASSADFGDIRPSRTAFHKTFPVSGRQEPFHGDARVENVRDHRLRSSWIICSAVVKGPVDAAPLDRIFWTRFIKFRRRASSAGVGTFSPRRASTSAEIDLLFARARLRSAAYKSSGTFST